VSETAAIELHKFSKWYGRIIAVNDVSVTIGRGVTGLLGPNGAGKTSLLRCMSGQMRPSLGAVRLLGQDPWRNPSLAPDIGLCTDQGWLMDELTPAEMIGFDLRLRGVEPGKARDRAVEALEQFDLGHAVDRRINTLSRGTRQRVKLAQAFAYDPEVLLLDEPLTGIDPVARATTVKRIKERGAAGRCVLVSSHVLHEVESMTEQVLLLHKGRLVAYGNAMEIRDLLDQHPHRIAVECDRPRDLAKAMVDLPSVQGFSFPSESVVEFHTKLPDECYAAVPARALEADIKIRKLTSPDATLEMLFRYLVGEGA
jgi:ABC-2 type transport system ATP-binding protein